MMIKRTAFFVSDGPGLTVEALGHSLMTQFEDVEFRQHRTPFINTPEKAHAIVARINESHRTDGQRRRHFPHGGERRRSGIGHLHPRDAELAECLTHRTLLHRRGFDDQHIEILERSVQAKALPHGKTPPLYAAGTRIGAHGHQVSGAPREYFLAMLSHRSGASAG